MLIRRKPMPYLPPEKTSIGETIIITDGTRRVLANSYFVNAKLMNESTLLKLYYSYCRVEIAGENLNAIFNDIVAGKMGTISIDENIPQFASIPVITSIIYIPIGEDISDD